MPVAYGLFAFALAVYGIRFASVSAATLAAGPATVALNYAVLIAGIAETLAGVLAVIKGSAYPGYVTPDALAWYVLVLIVPVAILAVPAVIHREIAFSVAFVALIVLLLLLGLGYHNLNDALSGAAASGKPPAVSTAVDLVKASSWFGFIAAAAIWWVFAREVYLATGLLRARRPRSAS